MIKIFEKGKDNFITAHLKQYELDCHCDSPLCRVTLFHTKIGELFEVFRSEIGRPLIINSAFRCPHHNAGLKNSSTKSYHQAGMALDIKKPDRLDFVKFVQLAAPIFPCMIHYEIEQFIHVDVRGF